MCQKTSFLQKQIAETVEIIENSTRSLLSELAHASSTFELEPYELQEIIGRNFGDTNRRQRAITELLSDQALRLEALSKLTDDEKRVLNIQE